MNSANIRTFGDDGLGLELACLVLRPFRIVFGLRLVVADGGVFVAWEYRTAFFLAAVGRADLCQFRLCGNGVCDVCAQFGLIAGGVGATVTLFAEVIAKQQLVMSCPLGAIGTTARDRNKLRVPIVERRILQDEKDVRVNPELQVADGQQNTRRFLTIVVYLFETGRESLFLLVGGQLRQQQGVSGAAIATLDVQSTAFGFRRLPNAIAADFLLIGAIVYALDKLASRSATHNAWTRLFKLTIPVSDVSIWRGATAELGRCVSFLTGDDWQFEFIQHKRELFGRTSMAKIVPHVADIGAVS